MAPRHVCLLFRRFTQWGADVTQPYVEALEARGIPHMLVGGKSFHAREEVESLRTALDRHRVARRRAGGVRDARAARCSRSATRRCSSTASAAAAAPVPAARRRTRGRRPPASVAGGRWARAARASCIAGATAGRPRTRSPRSSPRRARTPAFILRPSGEQALANVLRIVELARALGGVGRHLVPRLRRVARRGGRRATRAEAPIVEEGSEGVRIMTVHRAKGLEFPVVILADIGANIAAQNPGRYVDAGARALRGAPRRLVAAGTSSTTRTRSWSATRRGRARRLRRRHAGARPARRARGGRRPVRERMGGCARAAGSRRCSGRSTRQPSGGGRRRPRPAVPPFGEDSVLDAPGPRRAGPGQRAPGPARAGRAATRVSRGVVGSRARSPSTVEPTFGSGART